MDDLLIKPRLTDYYKISITQDKAEFAIPFLDSDIPLFLDPFLLWKSPSQQDYSLHSNIILAFNSIGKNYVNGNKDEATNTLITLSECDEIGLGSSEKRKGKRIGREKAIEILELFNNIPHIYEYGFKHFEIIQLLVDGISKDRISDITANLIKSFLIDFTIDECNKYNIPMSKVEVDNIYNLRTNKLDKEIVDLPCNPNTKEPIIFVPKRYLRFATWLSEDEYFSSAYIANIDELINEKKHNRIQLLHYNRENYGLINNYIKIKETNKADCNSSFAFNQIPITKMKAKLNRLKKLSTGRDGGADKEYENIIVTMLSSLLYPHLDFADDQVRTEGGVHIRDLIFYNNRESPILQDIYNSYKSIQIVFEIKNVVEVNGNHINQLERYLNENFGSFGVIVTRNPLKKAMSKNTIDLWSSRRKCILAISDVDLEEMVKVYMNKDYDPIDVIKKIKIDFDRNCPS